MIDIAKSPIGESTNRKVKRYYRFHAQIYDATRWSFLFGRKAVLKMIPDLPSSPSILEIGCGTGYNIRLLENHYPDAEIVGVDLSPDMLKVAQNKTGNPERIKLLEARYGSDAFYKESFDLILLSYSLTMMNQQYDELIYKITQDMSSNGIIAVVDFHNSRFKWFRRWMKMNHVDMNGNLLPLLQEHFYPVQTEVKKAYGGLWSYFKFVGAQR